MLVALTAGPTLSRNQTNSPFASGLGALLFYMAVYGVMNLGAFAALSYFRKPGTPDSTSSTPADEEDSAETLEDLSGAARRHPWASLALAICVLSLMGFPPTGGFLGKLYVFSAALSSTADSSRHYWMIVLVVIGVLNSAIAAAYYLRIIASCYLGKPAEGMKASTCRSLQLGLAVCAIVVLAVFFQPRRLYDQSVAAVADLHGSPAVTFDHRTTVTTTH
jgi:NADH-quinone oxidoreductase subunit N